MREEEKRKRQEEEKKRQEYESKIREDERNKIEEKKKQKELLEKVGAGIATVCGIYLVYVYPPLGAAVLGVVALGFLYK